MMQDSGGRGLREINTYPHRGWESQINPQTDQTVTSYIISST